MACFRCFFLGLDGKIVGSQAVDAPSPEEAVAASREAALRFGATGFEVWQREQRLHKETFSPRASLAILLGALLLLSVPEAASLLAAGFG